MNTSDNEALVLACLSDAAGMIRYELLTSASIELSVAAGYIKDWATDANRLEREHAHWELWRALTTLVQYVTGGGKDSLSEPDTNWDVSTSPASGLDIECAIEDRDEGTDPLSGIYDNQTGVDCILDAVGRAAKAQDEGKWCLEAYYLDLAWARLSRACGGLLWGIENHVCWDAYRAVALRAAARIGMDIGREMGGWNE